MCYGKTFTYQIFKKRLYMSQNIFKPIFDKINAMTLHEMRIRYCQLAPKDLAGNLDVIENVEFVTISKLLEAEKELNVEAERN
jgi:hypothetical protein